MITTYTTLSKTQMDGIREDAKEDIDYLPRQIAREGKRGKAEVRLPATVGGSLNAREAERYKADILRENGLAVTLDGSEWVITLAE